MTPRRYRNIPSQLAGALAVTIVVFAFALENSQRVTVDWLVATRESRLIYVIVVSALLGALIDRLLVRRR